MAGATLNNGFGNGQKMNAGGRIRARNPVLMSMQNNSSQQAGADIMGQNRSGSGGQHGNMLMPLSNRSLSPASYQ